MPGRRPRSTSTSSGLGSARGSTDTSLATKKRWSAGSTATCSSCGPSSVTRARPAHRRKYLPRLLIWAGLMLPPLLVLLTALPFLGADQISMLICAGVTGLLTIPIGLIAPFQLWQMFRQVPESAETDRLVLNELRWDKKFVPKGHELFTSEDYERMFDGA